VSLLNLNSLLLQCHDFFKIKKLRKAFK